MSQWGDEVGITFHGHVLFSLETRRLLCMARNSAIDIVKIGSNCIHGDVQRQHRGDSIVVKTKSVGFR